MRFVATVHPLTYAEITLILRDGNLDEFPNEHKTIITARNKIRQISGESKLSDFLVMLFQNVQQIAC